MLAILSDIHGNLAALEAVVADARAHGATRFLSLGDVVGYHCDPGPCIDLLASLGATNILGNHDGYVLEATNCPRSKVVAGIIEDHRRLLSSEQRDWLARSLPSLLEGGSLYVHGGPRDVREQYLYTVSASTFPPGVEALFSGHTHVQVAAKIGAKTYCNPGSVGQPRDGDSRAAYALSKDGELTLRRVSYDIQRTADAMRAAGYAPFHYENLFVGAQIGGRIDKVRIKYEDEA